MQLMKRYLLILPFAVLFFLWYELKEYQKRYFLKYAMRKLWQRLSLICRNTVYLRSFVLLWRLRLYCRPAWYWPRLYDQRFTLEWLYPLWKTVRLQPDRILCKLPDRCKPNKWARDAFILAQRSRPSLPRRITAQDWSGVRDTNARNARGNLRITNDCLRCGGRVKKPAKMHVSCRRIARQAAQIRYRARRGMSKKLRKMLGW